jgi:hypothetical protein
MAVLLQSAVTNRRVGQRYGLIARGIGNNFVIDAREGHEFCFVAH